jgi:fructoselysine-6-P-deglycase FrlB-like protein
MSDGRITFREGRRDQARTLAAAVGAIRDQVLALQLDGRLDGPGPIFVAIGASHAAAAAPVWVMRSRGIEAVRLVAGDLPLPYPVTGHPLIGVSQSGQSPETIAVLESVQPGLRHGVTNRRPSVVDDLASVRVWLGNLPDSYASTIGYTATLMALGMLADAWGGGAIDPAWEDLPALIVAQETMIGPRIEAFSRAVDGAVMVDFVGGGPSVGSAEAGALLLREVARFPAAAHSTRQYLHGPMESSGRAVHVLLGDERERRLAATLSESGRSVLLVTTEAAAGGPCLDVVQLPALRRAPRAVLEAVVMQALAESVASRAGVDIEAFVFHNDDTKVASEATR